MSIRKHGDKSNKLLWIWHFQDCYPFFVFEVRNVNLHRTFSSNYFYYFLSIYCLQFLFVISVIICVIPLDKHARMIFLEVHLSKYSDFKFWNPSIIFQEVVWHVMRSFFSLFIFLHIKNIVLRRLQINKVIVSFSNSGVSSGVTDQLFI